MKHFIFTTLIVGLIGIVPQSAEGTLNITSFSLTDQFDKTHYISFPSSYNQMIFVADRESSPQAKEWGEYVKKNVKQPFIYTTIAAMGNIPGWQRGFVKGFIQSDPKPRLLDWDNTVSRKWGYLPRDCMILVVSKNGTVVSIITGNMTTKKIETMRLIIE